MTSHLLRRRSLVALLAVAALSIGTLAWAGPGGGPGGPFGRDLFSAEKLASELELTDTQRSAVEQLMDNMRNLARPHVRKLMAQHKAMRDLAGATTFDEAAVRKQAAEGAAATTELAVIHARNEFELRKLLTPAQRDKLNDMHGRRHRR